MASLSSQDDTVEATFRLVRDDELEVTPPPQALITDVISARDLAVVFGPSAVGKTFILLDMAFRIATGLPWFNHAVTQGTVVYIAAEGMGGLPARVRAWKDANGISDACGVHFLTEPVDLSSRTEVKRLERSLLTLDPKPTLVIVDTLARCIGDADENSARDMGNIVRHVDTIRFSTGASVLLVHHTGKKGNAERGSSALRGAADCMLTVERAKTDKETIWIASGKNRNLPSFKSIPARLIPYDDACVVVSKSDHAKYSEVLSKKQQDTMCALANAGGGPISNSGWGKVSGLPDRTFQNARGVLVTAGYVQVEGDGQNKRYQITDKGRGWITANCKPTAMALQSSDSTLLQAISSPVGGECSSAAVQKGEQEVT